MKKFAPIFVPIALWIADYFLWQEAAIFVEKTPTFAGLWWIVTCMVAFGLTLVSLGWAITKIVD